MHRNALALTLLLAPLAAQAPTPAPAPAQAAVAAPAVPFAQRLKEERAEVSRLLEALQPKEALARALTLLPTARPVWNNTDANAQWNSYLTHKDVASAYYLAYRAALAAGEWEKALEYIKQAESLSHENAVAGSEAFTKISKAHADQADGMRKGLKENEAYVKELQAKPEKNAGDLQTLELFDKENKAIEEHDKWAKQFLLYADTAKKEGDRFDSDAKTMDERMKAEASQIAGYKPGKGDKGKWVDAIVSNPSYLSTSFPDKRNRFEFLCRLAVLDPANAKVTNALDVELGKAPAPKPKPAPKAKPKKD